MKRTERIGAIIKILTDTPNKSYTLQYFCDLFGAAKSSISEDIKSANEALRFTGGGYLETSAGAKGGVKFVPDISDEAVKNSVKDCPIPGESWAGILFILPTCFTILSLFSSSPAFSHASSGTAVQTMSLPLKQKASRLLPVSHI